MCIRRKNILFRHPYHKLSLTMFEKFSKKIQNSSNLEHCQINGESRINQEIIFFDFIKQLLRIMLFNFKTTLLGTMFEELEHR